MITVIALIFHLAGFFCLTEAVAYGLTYLRFGLSSDSEGFANFFTFAVVFFFFGSVLWSMG